MIESQITCSGSEFGEEKQSFITQIELEGNSATKVPVHNFCEHT